MPVEVLSFKQISNYSVGYYITNAAASDDSDKARNHEAVVQNKSADFGGAGPVKADTGQIRWIGWQEEVTIAG